MAKRRPLIEGLKKPLPKADPKKEEAFVYGDKPLTKEPRKKTSKPKPEPAEPTVTPEAPWEEPAEQAATPPPGKSPLTTRLRTDFAAALKRASLERQLEGKTPSTVQDILEEALEPWLKEHGYLK